MIIYRALVKELCISLMTITLILMAIFLTNQFMISMQGVAKGQITITAVVQLMALQVPLFLSYLLPLASFLSILLVLGRWYLDSEMVVLSACGFSPLKLLGMVMTVAVAVSIFVGWLSLSVGPIIQAKRVDIATRAIASLSASKVAPYRFQPLGQGGVYYAQEVSRSDGVLHDVFVAYKDENKQTKTTHWDIIISNKAYEKTYKDRGTFVVFEDGYRYQGIVGQNDFQVSHYKRYGVKPASDAAAAVTWPKSASTKELWQKAGGDKQGIAELQWRIAMPIWTLILAFLAFPLTNINPRMGKLSFILPAILLYIAYGDLLFLARAWLSKGTVPLYLGLWWVHGLMLLIALAFLGDRILRRYR